MIIGKRLPYTFAAPKKNVSKLAALFRQAMVPKQYAGKNIEFPGITILRHQDKLVSFGALKVNAAATVNAVSRLYLAEPEKGLLVMVKREWHEKPAAPPAVSKKAGHHLSPCANMENRLGKQAAGNVYRPLPLRIYRQRET